MLQVLPVAIAIGAWALGASAQQYPVTLAMANVGAEVVGDSPEEFAACISSERIKYAKLECEITESVLMQDVGSVITRLHELGAMGVALAVDDWHRLLLAGLPEAPSAPSAQDRSRVRQGRAHRCP